MTAAVLLLLLAAEPEEDQPRLLATVRVNTGFADLLGASVMVHAIPYVDLEGGGALISPAWFVRAGPRYMLVEARPFTVRVAALFGYKLVDRANDVTRGFHFGGTVDFNYWFARHFGLSVQLSGGATYDASRAVRKMLPDLRLGVGVSF